jgi:hypothetical protein
MMTASHCDCLICRLEASIIAEISDPRSNEEFRLFTVTSPILSVFPTASELIHKLRDHDNNEQNSSSDEILRDLLRRGSDTLFRPMWQRLLLLVFVQVGLWGVITAPCRKFWEDYGLPGIS